MIINQQTSRPRVGGVPSTFATFAKNVALVMCISSFLGCISDLWQSQKSTLIWYLPAHISWEYLCSIWMCGKSEAYPSGWNSRTKKKKKQLFFSWRLEICVSLLFMHYSRDGNLPRTVFLIILDPKSTETQSSLATRARHSSQILKGLCIPTICSEAGCGCNTW